MHETYTFQLRHDGEAQKNITLHNGGGDWHSALTTLLKCENAPRRALIASVTDATEAIKILRPFMGPAQIDTLGSLCRRGEESQFFRDKLVEMADLVRTMPKTYEQDGQGDDALVSLHYFAGGQSNWWITEKDKYDSSMTGEPGQHQAFGLADFFGDGGELGYISIVELLANGAELDLYFTPRTLGEVRKGK